MTSRHVPGSSSEGYECEDDVAAHRPGSLALTVTDCDVGGVGGEEECLTLMQA